MPGNLIDVLVPIPSVERFTYKLPEKYQKKRLERGIRVRVPLRNRTVIGVFWDYSDSSKTKRTKHKLIKGILDELPLLDNNLLELADWASRYYHHPLGEVITYFFPPSLRKGQEAKFKESIFWKITNKGDFFDLSKLNRAYKQREGLELLREKGDMSQKSLKAYGVSSITLDNLYNKKLVQKRLVEQPPLNSHKDEEIKEKKNNFRTKKICYSYF